MSKSVQIRFTDGALIYVDTVKEAFEHPLKTDIEKISFTFGKERIILDREEGYGFILRDPAWLDKWASDMSDYFDELKEIKELELEQSKAEHPCFCVKLNSDLEIYDMQEQERRNRNPLSLGLVTNSLSARKDCPECKGTGKPNGS